MIALFVCHFHKAIAKWLAEENYQFLFFAEILPHRFPTISTNTNNLFHILPRLFHREERHNQSFNNQ